MSKTLNDINFIELLPSSIAGDEKMIAAALALDNELKSVSQAIKAIDLYSNIDNLDEPVLKHLAWQWHVDFWDDALTIEQKRVLVKKAYPWHRIKGTPAAVEDVIRDVLGGGYLKEWWEYGGEPYHFRIFSNSPPEDANKNAQLLAAIEATKNKRSLLDGITNPVSSRHNIYFGGALVVGATSSISDEGEWN